MPDPAATPTLEAVGVRKRYPGGTEALRGVDLDVAEGETVALIGESGSGKTTLLRTFNRLIEPTSGTVRLRGKNIQSQDPIELRRHLGYVQQEGGLLPHWTVSRNIGLVPNLLSWDPHRIEARIREMLELVGLDPAEHGQRYPRSLSGGQRQRVAIARALAADPDLVLLDEPFGALDPITKNGMQREFIELKKRLGKTVVLVTHDLHEAYRLADRIAVLLDGSIEQFGTTREIREHPRTDYVQRLVQGGAD